MGSGLRGKILIVLVAGAILGAGVLIGRSSQKLPPTPAPALPVKTIAERPEPAEAPRVRRPSPAEPSQPSPAPPEVEAPKVPAGPLVRPAVPTKITEAQRAAVVKRWGKAAPPAEGGTKLELDPQAASLLANVDDRRAAGDRPGAIEMYRKAQHFTRDANQRELLRYEMTGLYDQEGDEPTLAALLDEIGRTTTRLDLQVAAAERLDQLEKKRGKN